MLRAEMSYMYFLDNLFGSGLAPVPPPPRFPGCRQSVASLFSPEGTDGHELKASPGQASSALGMPEVRIDANADTDTDGNSGADTSLSERPHTGAAAGACTATLGPHIGTVPLRALHGATRPLPQP